MQRSAAEVLEAALALPEDERAQLAEKLVASVDGEVAPDAEAAWGQESERRLFANRGVHLRRPSNSETATS